MSELVKILKPNPEPPADPVYLKMHCPYCWSELAFRNIDAWVVEPLEGVARIECPVCRRKVHFQHPTVKWVVDPENDGEPETIDKYIWETASNDASKSRLQSLLEKGEM